MRGSPCTRSLRAVCSTEMKNRPCLAPKISSHAASQSAAQSSMVAYPEVRISDRARMSRRMVSSVPPDSKSSSQPNCCSISARLLPSEGAPSASPMMPPARQPRHFA